MQKALITIAIFALIILILVSPTEARGEGDDTGDKLFGYAESLFSEGDFYRAITEYKRFIFFFPEDKKTEKCYFKIGESYFKAKRWQESVDALKVFIERFPSSPFLNDALYLRGMAEKNLNKLSDALSTFDEIIERGSGEDKNRAIYQKALLLVDMKEWKRAGEAFSTIPEKSIYSPGGRIFSSGLENIDNLPRKSPTTAGVLAAIIPGTGHLYTERPRDALVAFLLNGAFIWAAVELFDDGENVAGGVVTFFELGWYTGNIYSAVGSAHKYNRKVEEEFFENLKKRSSLSYYHDNRRSSNYLMLSMSF